MARGINKVILIGNLGADPDFRTTQSGSPVTGLNIATDESYKDKTTGQMVPKTEWHKVVMFNRLAEVAAQYLNKGSKIYIEGKLQTRKWQDQSGQDRYTTEIVAHELQMLDSKPEGQQQGQQAPQQQAYQQPQQNGYQQPAQNAQRPQGQPMQQRPQQRQPQAQPSNMAQNPRNYAQNQANTYQQSHPGAPQNDFDDDIPFN